MKALYALGGRVPASRVLREHRAALLPLVLVLAANLIALIVVVLPLSQRVESAERRAEAAERQRAAAEADFKRAEALRDAKARAMQDLDTFYRDVLPANVAVARRMLQLKLRQQAEGHGVEFQGSGSTEDQLRESSLLRLTMSLRLAGSYDDIRGFIYDLETSPDFVVIDQLKLAENTRGTEQLTVSLDVSTFYRDPQAVAQAGNNAR